MPKLYRDSGEDFDACSNPAMLILFRQRREECYFAQGAAGKRRIELRDYAERQAKRPNYSGVTGCPMDCAPHQKATSTPKIEILDRWSTIDDDDPHRGPMIHQKVAPILDSAGKPMFSEVKEAGCRYFQASVQPPIEDRPLVQVPSRVERTLFGG